eukprot:5069205-Pyramimonas_sp.AAC.3
MDTSLLDHITLQMCQNVCGVFLYAHQSLYRAQDRTYDQQHTGVITTFDVQGSAGSCEMIRDNRAIAVREH